ncbi:MAG: sulfotransferase [Candidatus Schekmanbacteria bacterium]|nr:sulfotransferase [Candidatus Schekmanbacteria bacterium]
MLPNFLYIGTYRGGTTWLYQVLKEHPDIYLPAEKELMFFTYNYANGLDWYQNFFTHYKGQKYAGEINPSYLTPPEAAERIYKHVPSAKLAMSLRNPVDQIFSLYSLWIARGYTDQDLPGAIREYPEFLDNVLYYKHINQYLKYFDQKNMLVQFYDDLVANPRFFLEQLYRFLEVRDWYPEGVFQVKNETRNPKSQKAEKIIAGTGDWMRKHNLMQFKTWLNNMGVSEYLKRLNTTDAPKKDKEKSAELRRLINSHIAEDKAQLEKFVGRDLSFWK